MLINKEFVRDYITTHARFQEYHGASGDCLGTGVFNYDLPKLIQAKLCVCLGSGGGFVPRLMRQAQRDLGIDKDSRTVIVDGNLKKVGWGWPDYLDKDCFFRENFDVEVIVKRTVDAAEEFTNIDYLHIDADHTYKAVKADYEAYRPLMSKRSFITLHDTQFHLENPRCEVHKLVDELRESGVQIIDIHIGGGLGIIAVNDD